MFMTGVYLGNYGGVIEFQYGIVKIAAIRTSLELILQNVRSAALKDYNKIQMSLIPGSVQPFGHSLL